MNTVSTPIWHILIHLDNMPWIYCIISISPYISFSVFFVTHRCIKTAKFDKWINKYNTRGESPRCIQGELRKCNRTHRISLAMEYKRADCPKILVKQGRWDQSGTDSQTNLTDIYMLHVTYSFHLIYWIVMMPALVFMSTSTSWVKASVHSRCMLSNKFRISLACSSCHRNLEFSLKVFV